MPQFIEMPSVVQGVAPKLIEEHVGAVNTATTDMSVARMVAPPGWTEPGQRPEFDELTLVLDGAVQVETESDVHVVEAGQAIRTFAGERVRNRRSPTAAPPTWRCAARGSRPPP